MFTRFDFVHPAEELERVARRQLIPELRALAEHGADPKRQLASLPRRDQAEHVDVPRVRLQDTREHLQHIRRAQWRSRARDRVIRTTSVCLTRPPVIPVGSRSPTKFVNLHIYDNLPEMPRRSAAGMSLAVAILLGPEEALGGL